MARPAKTFTIGSVATIFLTYLLHLPFKLLEDAFFQWANERIAERWKVLMQSTSLVISWVFPLFIAVLVVFFVYKLGFKEGKSKAPTYAPGRHHYSLSVAGVTVVIDNIEESLESVSITGTVDKRPRAVVLNKRRLPPNLSAKEKLEKYAWELVEVDLKKRA